MTCASQASSATACLSPPRASRTTRPCRRSAGLEVGEDQLRLDRLDVARGVDAALGVDDVRVAVRADDVDERVGLADVREELVAEALALVRAGDEAGDVVEGDRVPDDLARADDLRDLLEALVDHGHDGDVRLDRRERVVGGLRAGLGERVEQRGLAGVRHPDDPDLHRATLPTAPPSSAPAATSAGVVDAEVDAAERHRARCRVEQRRGQQARVGTRRRERRGGVGAREAELGRRLHERRQVLHLRPRAADDELECRVEDVGPGDRGDAARPAPAPAPIQHRAGQADREPQRAVLAERRETADGIDGRWVRCRAADGAQQREIDAHVRAQPSPKPTRWSAFSVRT